MEPQFWHDKWENNQIAFHNEGAHPLLLKHWSSLGLSKGSRVFIPLCGKTRDIAWFLAQGYHVVGVELSELAIQQLFSDLGIEPQIETIAKLHHYQAQNIDIYEGDIFELSKTLLDKVDAIYDRAALVALPQTMRAEYAAHIQAISMQAAQLIICFEYNQDELNGPPFSVDEAEVTEYYADNYSLNILEKVPVERGLKGQCHATEVVWSILRK
jgi:thiopurine S-methyltransferase